MWYICGRSRICIAMMVLRDLPRTCTCTWCCIQIKWWKQNNGSAGFKNQRALNSIGTKTLLSPWDLLLRSLGYLPEGFCLKSKVGYTRRCLPWCIVDENSYFCFCRGDSSFFCGARWKNQNHFQTKTWIYIRETYLGYWLTSPTLGVRIVGNTTQVCGVQVPFRNCSLTKTYQGVEVGVAPMLVGVTGASFFFLSPPEIVIDQKYPKEF